MTQPSSVLSKELLPASIAIFVVVGLAAFNALGVSAALPELAAELGKLNLLPWVVTTYLIVAGVSTVASGALIDTIGLRFIFRWALVFFIAGSVLGGLAPSMELLIAARFVQGIGGGGVIAVGLAGVNLLYPSELVGRAFAANSTVWGVMGVAGPLLAGFLLEFASWRFILFVNLPFGLLALAAGWAVMPGPVDDRKDSTLDTFGLVIVLAFNVLLLLAIDSFGLSSIWFGLGALATAAYFLWRADRHPDPVMRHAHLLHRPYGLLAATVSLLIAGGLTAESFITVFVRGARGGSDRLTSFSVVFFVVGWTVGSNLSSRMMDRHAESTVIARGFASTIVGLSIATTTAALDSPLPAVFTGMALAGIGLGGATNAGLTLLQAVTPANETGRATAAHQFYRNLGFTGGTATGGAAILFVATRQLGDLEIVRDLLASPENTDVAGAAAIADGFATAVGIGLLYAVIGLIPLYYLRRSLADDRAVADERRQYSRYVQ